MKKEDFVSLGVSEDVSEKAAGAFESAVGSIRLESAVDSAVKCSGARNVKAVKALLDLTGVGFSDGGKLTGLDEQLNLLKKSPDSEFLFNSENNAVRLVGAVSGETGRETPDNRVDFSKLSYSELCAFLESNPKVKL